MKTARVPHPFAQVVRRPRDVQHAGPLKGVVHESRAVETRNRGASQAVGGAEKPRGHLDEQSLLFRGVPVAEKSGPLFFMLLFEPFDDADMHAQKHHAVAHLQPGGRGHARGEGGLPAEQLVLRADGQDEDREHRQGAGRNPTRSRSQIDDRDVTMIDLCTPGLDGILSQGVKLIHTLPVPCGLFRASSCRRSFHPPRPPAPARTARSRPPSGW